VSLALAVLAARTPTQPAISAVAISSLAVQISLTTPSVEPVSGIAFYSLWVSTHGGPFFQVQEISPGAFPYIFAAAASTAYQFYITATDNSPNGDTSQESAIQAVMTPGSGVPTPSTPAITATPLSSSAISVGLTTPSTEPVNGIKNYVLLRSVGGSGFNPLITLLPTQWPYTDTGLSASTAYSYQTYAVDNDPALTPSANSATTTATTQGTAPAIAGIKAFNGKFVSTLNGQTFLPIGIGVLGMETVQGGPPGSSGWPRDEAVASITGSAIAAGIQNAVNNCVTAGKPYAQANCIRININSAKLMGYTGRDPFGNLSGNYYSAGTDSAGHALYSGGPGGGPGSGIGHETPGNPANYRTQLTAIINTCLNEGYIVFINMMWGTPTLVSTGQYVLPAGQTAFPCMGDVAAWQYLATQWKNNPAVVFELMNEPFGTTIYANCIGNEAAYLGSQTLSPFAFPTSATSPNGLNGGYGMLDNITNDDFAPILGGGQTCYCVGHQVTINAIRAITGTTGTTNMIAASPNNFAGEPETWAQAGGRMVLTDPANNMCATFHAYGYANGTGPMFALTAAGIAFICTEMGNLAAAGGTDASYNGYRSQGWGYIWWGWPIYEGVSNPNSFIEGRLPWTGNNDNPPAPNGSN
jgi:hypothetical protein